MRIKELSYKIWSLLTESERETYCYDIGLIGFIERVSDLIGFNIDSLSYEELDLILQQLN